MIKRIASLLFIGLIMCIAWTPGYAAEPHWLAEGMTAPGEHPRSVIRPGDVETVQERITREPYGRFFRVLHDWAGREYELNDDHDYPTEQKRANAARAAAYLFYLNRTLSQDSAPVAFESEVDRVAYGQRAKQYLLHMKTDSRAKGVFDSIKDIHTAQELHLWAETLELLLGADVDVLGDDTALAIQNVADLAADFYADYNISNWWILRAEVANHRSKSAAALGIAAIVLNGVDFEAKNDDGRYDPALWIDFALRYSDLTLRDTLLDYDGGFQEGPTYIRYSGIDHDAFMYSWHRYTGGASYDLHWDETIAPYYVLHASETYRLPDLWTDEWHQRQLLATILDSRPDGTMPPLDDSTPGSSYHYGILVNQSFELAPLFRWAWERVDYAAGGSVLTEPLLLVTYDDSIAAQSPEDMGMSPSVALPHAGRVVFRSDWSQDAVFGIISCEHGKASAHIQTRWGDYFDGAAGHEHPDPGSFLLDAYGEPLALDAGYLGWNDHTKVNTPLNHNIILVDGEGPQMPKFTIPDFTLDDEGEMVFLRPEMEGGWAPGADGEAWMVHADVTTPGVHFTEVFTEYSVDAPLTELRRKAVFLADRFLVLFDTMKTNTGDAGAEHTYTFQLHGNGGATSGGDFMILEGGGLWSRENARLRAQVISDSAITFTTSEAIHDAGHWEELTHTALNADISTTESATGRFMAALLPEKLKEDDSFEEFQMQTSGNRITWQDSGVECAAWFDEPTDIALNPEITWSVQKGAYCRSAERFAGMFHGVGSAGDLLITAQFEYDAQGTVTNWSARIHRGNGTVAFPYVPGKSVSGACEIADGNEALNIAVTAGMDVMVTDSVEATAVALMDVAGVPAGSPPMVELGETMMFSGSRSCAANTEELSYEWILTDKPELSLAAFSENHGAKTTLEADLPGVYVVTLNVSAAGLNTGSTTMHIEVVGEMPWPSEEDGDADMEEELEEDIPSEEELPAESEVETFDSEIKMVEKSDGCASTGIGLWVGLMGLALMGLRRRRAVN